MSRKTNTLFEGKNPEVAQTKADKTGLAISLEILKNAIKTTVMQFHLKMLQALNKQSTTAKSRLDTTFLNCKWLILELRCLSTALISSNLFLRSNVKLTLH